MSYPDGLNWSDRAAISELSAKAMLPIKTIVLSEAASAITITADGDGAALSLSSARVVIYAPAGINVPTGSSDVIYARINDIANNYHNVIASDGNDNGDHLQLGLVRNVWSILNWELIVCNEATLFSISDSAFSDGTARARDTCYGGLDTGIESITKIYAYLANGYSLPAGTIIKLWGTKT